MRPYIVAGNWKMHMDSESGTALARSIHEGLAADPPSDGVSVVLCPPFPVLSSVQAAIAGSGIGLGAQNMHNEDHGAFTGEVAPGMLRAVGCTFVILGHSERRQHFHEDDAFINRKLRAALTHGLTPIVCVGETLEQREAGITEEVVGGQVRGVLAGITAQEMKGVVLAYEPIWAIGTGRTATPEQAQEVHADIRGVLASLFDRGLADRIVIQYGGSVKADNAAELFACPDVDGGLIGGASLKAQDFLAIIRAASTLAG
ncbi:MAG: triose-phosphate isomerase [Bacteroidetes bacterium]|nr:triose-phosphate isomerase [Bacteroidota bacterium]